MEEEKGKTLDEMSLKELRELAISLEVLGEEEAKKARTVTLLKKLKAWEEEKLAELEAKDRAVVESLEVEEEPKKDKYNGKEVLSRELKEINGKEYEEIATADGATYLEPKK